MSAPRVFREFRAPPEIIRLTVVLYVRHPLSLRNVEGPLHERRIGITRETVRSWWNRFGAIFAAEIQRSRFQAMRHLRQRCWHLAEVFEEFSNREVGRWLSSRVENSLCGPSVPINRSRTGGRCPGSAGREACRHSQPFGPIRSALSSHALFSRTDAPLRLLGCAVSVRPDRGRGGGHSETFLVCITAPRK
jgi:hypothetical protein